jgi:predicted transposase/invertase (TIGR01784 family)
MPKKPSKPHDEFFKATFGRLEVALDYLQKMLPAEIIQTLDTSKLKRVNGSYVSTTLREFFSDLIFECPLKNIDQRLRISLLFEHKNNLETYPHFQVLRYMLDTWEEQLKQKKELTPIIPIIIYQGANNWHVRAMSSYFAATLPSSLLRFLPTFEYHFTNVTTMPDEAILALGKSLLVNTFFMMKYIRNPAFIIENHHLIFVNLEEPQSPRDFMVILFAYFLKNSELAKEKIQDFIEELPKTLNKSAMSTYEMILEEGRKNAMSTYEMILEEGRKSQQELLAKERERAEEALRREEEERLRAEEEYLRAEEERLRLDNVIYRLYEDVQLSISEIAIMTGRDEANIEALVQLRKNDNA